jgi:hypothetical protein
VFELGSFEIPTKLYFDCISQDPVDISPTNVAITIIVP